MTYGKPTIHMPVAPASPASRRPTDRMQAFNEAVDAGWSPPAPPDMNADELRALREELQAARTIPPPPAPVPVAKRAPR